MFPGRFHLTKHHRALAYVILHACLMQVCRVGVTLRAHETATVTCESELRGRYVTVVLPATGSNRCGPSHGGLDMFAESSLVPAVRAAP